MRNFGVCLAALLAFAFAGVQPAEAQQNMIGVKGGFVSATISSDDIEDLPSSRTGFGAGAFLQVMVAPSVSIQPEALFLMKGAEDESGDFTAKSNYAQVPILVQYHVPAAGVSPRLFAGPSVAFEISCDVEFGGGSETCEESGLDTKSADFGLVFGGGVDVPLGGFVGTFDVRYDLGVSDILDAPEGDASVKNRAWEVFAGVGFTP